MEESKDINDLFDEIVFVEDRLISVGYKEGFEKGSQEGKQEGVELGFSKGIEIGQEIGFYVGFTEGWLKHFTNETENKKSEKVLSSLDKLNRLAKDFPSDNLKDVDVVEKLDVMRAKFKIVCSLLKIPADYTKRTTTW